MRFLIVMWVAVLLSISLAPSNVKAHFIRALGPSHTVGHFWIFLVTALILSAGAPTLHSKLLRCSSAILVGLGAEAMEVAYFHSRFEWRDVWVDSAGVSLGAMILIVSYLFFWLDRRNNPGEFN